MFWLFRFQRTGVGRALSCRCAFCLYCHLHILWSLFILLTNLCQDNNVLFSGSEIITFQFQRVPLTSDSAYFAFFSPECFNMLKGTSLHLCFAYECAEAQNAEIIFPHPNSKVKNVSITLTTSCPSLPQNTTNCKVLTSSSLYYFWNSLNLFFYSYSHSIHSVHYHLSPELLPHPLIWSP